MSKSSCEMPIAIVGMACQLPGADSPERFWEMLIEGRSAIREIPSEKLELNLYYDPREKIAGKVSSRLGAFLSQKPWGEAVSRLPSNLVETVDPVHLRFFETATEAFSDSGYDPFDLPCRDVGVYVGHDSPSSQVGDQTIANYSAMLGNQLAPVLSETSLAGTDLSQRFAQRIQKRFEHQSGFQSGIQTSDIAGLTSRGLGLSGPALVVDAACASSLQAVYSAVRALQSGRIKMALAGGAADWKLDTIAEFSKAGAHSATGSSPFDERANGVICGEGYAAVVLKPLVSAIAEGNRIWGVISGIGASADGRGKGVWAPQKSGQVRAIRRAYQSKDKLAAVQFIEAHATSTRVGDATELSALGEVFSSVLPQGQKIPVTSVKANIGHTLEAAGMAGLIKTLLSMQRTEIPPQINFENPNSNIDWENLPLYVPTSRTPWPAPGRGKPRSAGVNAFGLGGFNLHVALEEYIGKGATTVTVIQSFDSTEAHIELKKEKGVAIIGRGCLLPQARNIKELQVFLTNPQSDKSYLSDFQYDWRRHKIPPRQLEQADPLHFYLLEAVDQALEEAGLSIEDCQRERVGTIVESQLGGDFTDHIQLGLRFPEIAQELCDVLKEDRCSTETVDSIIEQYEQRCQTQWPQYRDDSGSFHHSSLASRIVRTLDFQGPALMLEDASEIKAALFETAFQLLESGDCDVVICAAGSRHLGHASISQGSHSVEGAGAVILKKWNDAIRDGDAIYATLTEEDLSKRIRCDEWPEFISFGIGSKILQVLIQSCFPDSIN